MYFGGFLPFEGAFGVPVGVLEGIFVGFNVEGALEVGLKVGEEGWEVLGYVGMAEEVWEGVGVVVGDIWLIRVKPSRRQGITALYPG